MTRLRAEFRSDIGDRETNQDRAAVIGDGSVFLVADGMGGQRGGEVASLLAAETVAAGVAAEALSVQESARLGALAALFDAANQRLMAEARSHPALWGLGTTLTLGVVKDRWLYYGHIGDSRLYRWRDGRTELLTEDHTRAQEMVDSGVMSEEAAARSRHRNVLTRYLGTPTAVEPQLGRCDLRARDRLLLCSDGLHGSLGRRRLDELLASGGGPGEVADALVREALPAPPPRDNITALVVIVDDVVGAPS